MTDLVMLGWVVLCLVMLAHRRLRAESLDLRHPIYTAMFGMLFATGVALSSTAGFVVGVGLFLAGTALRVHFEEKLLRRRFGSEYDDYAAAVPAFIPRPGRPRRGGGAGV